MFRSPLNDCVADWLASTFRRSRMFEMFPIPPSTTCRLLMPSLRLRIPWLSSPLSVRYRLATASPAGSSPARVMR